MTDSNPQSQHPWSKYYADRGLARPVPVDLPAPAPVRPAARAARVAAPVISSDLQDAVAAVTAQAYVPGLTAAPFISAMQKEAVAREVKRIRRVRFAKLAALAAAVVVVGHLGLTHTVFQRPFASAVAAHVRDLPEMVAPFYSTGRQPLQAVGVAVVQADRIDAGTMRYVAAVTLRLAKPLYVPAVSNGTLAYRRLQESLVSAREQEMRFGLFAPGSGPELPELPLLLQRVHQAGETVVVRVPFTARRFGWNWRLEAPAPGLRSANRVLEGDSLDHYAGAPYLIFGDATTFAEVRRRVKLGNDYLRAVARAVQRQADVLAVAAPERPAMPAASVEAAAVPAVEGTTFLTEVDPNRPAVSEAEARPGGTAGTRSYFSTGAVRR